MSGLPFTEAFSTVRLYYWFGPIEIDLASGRASSADTGRPGFAGFGLTLWNLLKPRRIAVQTPLGELGADL